MDDALRARQLHQAGKLETAAACYLRALQAAPQDALLLHDYALLLMQSGELSDALQALRAIPPDAGCHPQSLLARAHCHRALGQLVDGIDTARHAAELLPEHPIVWLLLGSQQSIAGQHAEAIASLARALAIAPDLAEASHYLGESLQAQDRYADAAYAYRQAARAQPTEAINIGICAEMLGDLEQARSWYLEMERLVPGRLDNLVRLAHVCAQLCRMDESDAIATRVQAIDAQHSNTPLTGIEPFPLTYLPLSEAFKQRALVAHAGSVMAKAAQWPALPAMPAARTRLRLRLAYISPDLGRHAVGTLLQQHFEAHDRACVEVTAYSLRRFDDPVAARIAAGVEHFVDASAWPDLTLAERIRADGIDVLVDLGGYTHGARPAALAMRPAPVQLGWLGFIHAQEAPWLDAIVLDNWTAPETAWPYSDRVLRMRSPLLPAWHLLRPAPDRQRFGLPPADVPLLASFNNSYKLSRALLDAWVRILDAAPDARMLVFLRQAQARPGFLGAWRAAGGDASRLLFADQLPFDQQLARAASCDLFLDAFRYQAGATGVMSMAAGLPVLGVAGQHPLSRMGNALNLYLGMDELVAPDVQGYVDAAITLATNPDRLSGLRERLAHRLDASNLLSPRRTAAEIERIAMDAHLRQNAPMSRTS